MTSSVVHNKAAHQAEITQNISYHDLQENTRLMGYGTERTYKSLFITTKNRKICQVFDVNNITYFPLFPTDKIPKLKYFPHFSSIF